MSISSPCGCSFFNFSALSSSSSVFFLCGEQCCKYVSWLNRMLFSWPWTTHAHLTLSLFLSHYFSLTYKHTYAYIQWRAMGPLLHNREDSWRGLLSQFRCNTKQIMYITFSVCLHRHSLGVLGGKKHDNTTLTSHLQVICSRFVWASGSVKFLFLSSFFFASHRGSLCYLSLCKNPATGNILVLSWTGIHEQKEVPVFFLLSLPLVAVYIVHLVVFLVLSARTYWVETLASVCLCAVHVAVPKPGCASSSHPCAQMMCTPMMMLLSSRGRNSKLVLSFCRINTCLKSVKKTNFFFKKT